MTDIDAATHRAVSPRRLHRRRGIAGRRHPQRMKQVLAELIERRARCRDARRRLRPRADALAAEPRVRRIKKPHLVHPVFAEFMRSPRLARRCCRRCSGRAAFGCTARKLNLKSPEYGSPVEWHQDWAFYPHTNDDLLAVGVLLDDATEENGPLLVMPGSHRGPTYDHHGPDGRFCGAMDPARDRLDFAAAAAVDRAGRGRARSITCAPCTARRRTARRSRATCCSTSSPPPTRFRCSACPTGTSSTAGCWSARRRVVPRTVACPIRMPLPPARNQGSIYENQTALERRYFDQQASPRALQT